MLVSVSVTTTQPYRSSRSGLALDYERLTARRSVAASEEAVLCLLTQCGMPNGKRPCVTRSQAAPDGAPRGCVNHFFNLGSEIK
jgi:hypothetical protein